MHIPTLFLLLSSTSLLVALVLAWEGSRSPRPDREFFWWCAGYLSASLGLTLSAVRDAGFPFLGIGLSNAFVLSGYALVFKGVCVLTGRRCPSYALAIGLVWLAGYAVFAKIWTAQDRVALTSAVVVVYCSLTAAVLLGWREAVRTRYLAAALLILHSAFLAARVATAWASGAVVSGTPLSGYAFTTFIFEALMFALAIGFSFIIMVRERNEIVLRNASETDFLTGVLNRRAFAAKATLRLLRAARGGGPLACLVLDLDRFKQINDRNGHAVGDEVLKLFCDVVNANIDDGDVFGRTGGEEFSLLLCGRSAAAAEALAGKIVRDFAAAGRIFRGRELNATASVGMAIAGPEDADLHDLIASADEALYRAKRLGRNRLEIAPPTHPVDLLSLSA